MSILGITIDYGPFGFMDAFDGGYICNHSDVNGRYAYNMQPQIAHWNLYALGQALVALTDDVDATKSAVDSYLVEYAQAIDAVFRDQAWACDRAAGGRGADYRRDGFAASDARRLDDFLACACDSASRRNVIKVRDLMVDRAAFDEWADRYRARLRAEGSNDDERAQRMNRVNPKYILRNHLAEVAIRQARGDEGARDFGEVARLLKVLQRPYDEQPESESYAQEPPEWARTLELSCSS